MKIYVFLAYAFALDFALDCLTFLRILLTMEV